MPFVYLGGAMGCLLFLLLGELPLPAQEMMPPPPARGSTSPPNDMPSTDDIPPEDTTTTSNQDDPALNPSETFPSSAEGSPIIPNTDTETPEDTSLARKLLFSNQQSSTEPFLEAFRQRQEKLEDDPDVPELLPPSIDPSRPELSIIPVLKLGVATFRFGVTYTALFDDNILLSNQGAQHDFEHILSPRLSIGLGDYMEQKNNYLALDYEPQLTLFQRYSQYNALDHQLRLDSQYELSRTTLHGALSYSHSSDADRELQGRTSRDVVSADAGALYKTSDRISFELNGQALARTYEEGINSNEGWLQFWARYAVPPNWIVGIGGAGGALIPEQGATQLYAEPWVGAQAVIGPYAKFDIRVGGDFREPQNTGQVLSTPVFNATLNYQPSTEREFELSSVRQIISSPDVIDQDYISTKVAAKISQRFWGLYTVGLETGVENADYFQFGPGSVEPRSDNYPYAKVEISYARYKDLEFSAYYVIRRNFSSDSDSSFSDQQGAIQLRFGY
jgi:hypothetical protein